MAAFWHLRERREDPGMISPPGLLSVRLRPIHFPTPGYSSENPYTPFLNSAGLCSLVSIVAGTNP